MFRNREDAGRQLAGRFTERTLRRPIVLGIPRGGVVIGAVLARELSAELDVILARKLGAPGQPELAIGAVAENGEVYLNPEARDLVHLPEGYLPLERKLQREELARRREVYRAVRPMAELAERSVIVTDDGIATGATMIAALHAVRAQQPHEIIVAVPVASPDRLDEVRRHCDDAVCLACPRRLRSIGQYFEDFSQIDDAEVVAILREFAGGS